MKRFVTIALALTMLLGVLGVYTTQLEGHVSRYMDGMPAWQGMQVCDDEMCGESVASCTNHCVSTFVASSASPLVLVSGAVIILVVGMWLAALPRLLVLAPVFAAQSPPMWRSIRSTVKRE